MDNVQCTMNNVQWIMNHKYKKGCDFLQSHPFLIFTAPPSSVATTPFAFRSSR